MPGRPGGTSDSGEEAANGSAAILVLGAMLGQAFSALDRSNARAGGLSARVDAGTSNGAAGGGHGGNTDKGKAGQGKDRPAGNRQDAA